MERVIAYELRQVDLLRVSTDVVALKYAQAFHGADRAVAEALSQTGFPTAALDLPVGRHRLSPTEGAIGSPQALFVGVPELRGFQYEEVRRFSAQVLTILAREAPEVREVAMTLHGAGYGLDLVESAQQQYLGVRDAIEGGSFPPSLEAVVIVERLKLRVEAISDSLDQIADDFPRPGGWKATRRYEWPIYPVPEPKTTRAKSDRAIRRAVDEVAREPERKRGVFVAMPFARKMRDIWKYGIQMPVRAAGLLCERVDEEHFTGGILDRIKRKIEDAELIIADLTGQNPNVFLEVGYAWGKGRPVLFLLQGGNGDVPKLPFDVSTQKCLIYEDATDLEEKVGKALEGLGMASG